MFKKITEFVRKLQNLSENYRITECYENFIFPQEIFGNMLLMLLMLLSFRSTFRHFDCIVYLDYWVRGTYVSATFVCM